MKKCPNCNKKIKDDLRYCNHCGFKYYQKKTYYELSHIDELKEEFKDENNNKEIEKIELNNKPPIETIELLDKSEKNNFTRFISKITRSNYFKNFINVFCILFACVLFIFWLSANSNSKYTRIEDLSYRINDDNEIIITASSNGCGYLGKKDKVVINSKYQVKGHKYMVTGIDPGAFANTSTIKSIELPDTITYIDDNAFLNNTGITEITIPKNVIFIGKNSFVGCNNLTTIYYNAIKCNDISMNGHPFSDLGKFGSGINLIIDSEVAKIPAYLFSSAHSYDCINFNSIIFNSPSKLKEIGENAFMNSSINSISIPNTVYNLNNGAFKGSTLSKIHLPESITFISDELFYGCENLSSIVLPESVEIIGVRSFYNTNIKTIFIPKHMKKISDDAFEKSKLETINFESSKYLWAKLGYNDGKLFSFNKAKINFNVSQIKKSNVGSVGYRKESEFE